MLSYVYILIINEYFRYCRIEEDTIFFSKKGTYATENMVKKGTYATENMVKEQDLEVVAEEYLFRQRKYTKDDADVYPMELI